VDSFRDLQGKQRTGFTGFAFAARAGVCDGEPITPKARQTIALDVSHCSQAATWGRSRPSERIANEATRSKGEDRGATARWSKAL
jgi:hypothetical protein